MDMLEVRTNFVRVGLDLALTFFRVSRTAGKEEPERARRSINAARKACSAAENALLMIMPDLTSIERAPLIAKVLQLRLLQQSLIDPAEAERRRSADDGCPQTLHEDPMDAPVPSKKLIVMQRSPHQFPLQQAGEA